MIDRSKIKKMYVWNDNQDKVDRYIIDAFSDGSCLAVNVSHEKAFESGEAYSVRKWKHYAEIYEEEYRHFKVEEITEEFFDYLFRRITNGNIYRVTMIDRNSKFCLRISDGWMSLGYLYSNFKMKKPIYSIDDAGIVTKTYTDWMPVGVKE